MSTNSHIVAFERTTVRRERHFPIVTQILDLVRSLRESHSTGELSIHFSEGGICDITFAEQQHIGSTHK